MIRLPQTSGYSNPRVTVIQITVHPAGENPTNTSHAFHAQSRGSHIATFHTAVNIFEHIHCTREKGLLTQSTARRPSDSWVRTQLLSHNSQRAVGKSQAPVDNRLLGLSGLYHRACDRYVQYLLAGANRTVLNRHMRGLQP
jgi:hypothetical protein